MELSTLEKLLEANFNINFSSKTSSTATRGLIDIRSQRQQQPEREREDGARRQQTAEHGLRDVPAGVLGPAQAAVPGDPHQQGDRGVQQTVLRLGCFDH